MTTDTLTEALLEEAEAIVGAEWLRVHGDTALAESPFAGACAEAPAARPRPTPVAAVTTTLDRPGGPPPGSRQGSIRRRQDPVWPTQRSPPTHNQSLTAGICRTKVMPCYAFELMSQIRLKTPSHSWACRTRSDAGYEVEFGSEFHSQEQAACAGAESELQVFVSVLQSTDREAADKWKVDRSTVTTICRTPKQGALGALSARPGSPGKNPEHVEMEELRTAV